MKVQRSSIMVRMTSTERRTLRTLTRTEVPRPVDRSVRILPRNILCTGTHKYTASIGAGDFVQLPILAHTIA